MKKTTRLFALVLSVMLSVSCLVIPATVATASTSASTKATAPKAITKTDFKPYYTMTIADVFDNFGETAYGEENVDDLLETQGSKTTVELQYDSSAFLFSKGKIQTVYLLDKTLKGPRGMRVGMKEKDIIKLFPQTNSKIKTALANGKKLNTLLDMDGWNDEYLTIYAKKNVSEGVLFYLADADSEGTYRIGYMDIKSGYRVICFVKAGVVHQIGLFFSTSK